MLVTPRDVDDPAVMSPGEIVEAGAGSGLARSPAATREALL
jgi:hypothetical protein